MSVFGSQRVRRQVSMVCLGLGLLAGGAMSCDADEAREGGLDAAGADVSDVAEDSGGDVAPQDAAAQDVSDTAVDTGCEGDGCAQADVSDCVDGGPGCEEPDASDPPDCRGLRVYDWTDLDDGVIEGSYFSDHHWGTNIEHDPESISVVSAEDRLREPGTKSLRFYIDPRNPSPPDSTSHAGNLRAEIYESYEFHTGDTVSWAPDKPLKSEEWISWSYYYPPDFVAGDTASTKFMQAHVGHGAAPLDLRVWNPREYPDYPQGRCAGGDCDEFVLHRLFPDDGMDGEVAITDVKPEAGQWYDFVLHTVWDTESGGEGLTEFWINGQKYYSSAGGNTFENPENKDHPYGAMLKLGMYHGTWRYEDDIQRSLDEGVDHLEVFMGPVRILSRLEGDHIGADGLHCVTPQTARP
ncbi:hypothetical protein FIV42_00920 [Persicimonas caeni]|uniref:Polysaccharide lyase-like protein n=2 Tax=Persicimonas caeni TaxID=2292766 RepID=A0A4Y6PM01_PERCE|nr:hypothetical protein FIV42_00920 [Persicimonas caeni]QED30567.1 hypothetical protein FRD00_00915 [Persicimonas caeni]